MNVIGRKNSIVLGDFNLHYTRDTKNIENDLKFLCAVFGLSQFNNILNIILTALNIILCNNSIHAILCNSPLVDKHHPALEFNFSWKPV